MLKMCKVGVAAKLFLIKKYIVVAQQNILLQIYKDEHERAEYDDQVRYYLYSMGNVVRRHHDAIRNFARYKL